MCVLCANQLSSLFHLRSSPHSKSATQKNCLLNGAQICAMATAACLQPLPHFAVLYEGPQGMRRHCARCLKIIIHVKQKQLLKKRIPNSKSCIFVCKDCRIKDLKQKVPAHKQRLNMIGIIIIITLVLS